MSHRTILPDGDMLRAIGRFLQFRLLGRRVPLAAYWKITWRCNSSCLYCGVRSHPHDELSTAALVEYAADQILGVDDLDVRPLRAEGQEVGVEAARAPPGTALDPDAEALSGSQDPSRATGLQVGEVEGHVRPSTSSQATACTASFRFWVAVRISSGWKGA